MKKMQICVYADCNERLRGYKWAVLELPATPYEVEDALQRARVPEGGRCRLEIAGGWPQFLLRSLCKGGCIYGEKAIKELNLLADAVSHMDEIQLGAFEGAIQLRWAETGKTVTLKETVNLTACLDDYEFHPGVTNDMSLGRVCMEGGMLDLVEDLPDKVAALLDPEKVGKALRLSDHGAFTSTGYVYRGSTAARQDFYDGEHLPSCRESHQGLISLRIEKADAQGAHSSVWLELPADEKALRWALVSIGEESFEPCDIAETKSVIPMLQDQLIGCEDIPKLNLLSGRLKKLQQEAPDGLTLMKYKAVLEQELAKERYSDPETALELDFLDVELDIAANLDCYDYCPDILSPDAYGEYVLQSAGIDTGDPAFSRFDFQGYGKRMLEQAGCVFTPYGAVSRNGQEFVHEYTEPEQEAGQGVAMEQQ